MHARLTRFVGLGPERIEATIQEFEERSLPQLEQQAGFQGITVGVNHRSGQAVAIALWESEGHMMQSEELAGEAREQAVATGGPDRPPIVDHFEVLIHR
jgi:hypothetical protein